MEHLERVLITVIFLSKNIGHLLSKSSQFVLKKNQLTPVWKTTQFWTFSKKKLNKDNQDQDLLKKIKILYKTKKELDRLCSKEQISHQGLIAEIEHLKEANLKDYLKLKENKKNIIFIALEEVTDPRNIGSIIRSAASFKIDGLIVKDRHFPDESKRPWAVSSIVLIAIGFLIIPFIMPEFAEVANAGSKELQVKVFTENYAEVVIFLAVVGASLLYGSIRMLHTLKHEKELLWVFK